MAEMLGNNILPESVVSTRRRIRERVMDLRQPVRRFRENNIPGPDVIGTVENQLMDLRDNFVQRESVLSSIRERASGSDSSSSSSNDSGPNNMV